jgi:hypothetical protein
MTTQRRDGKSPSEFSDWFRNQDEIDSGLGFLNTNIDYAWKDKHSKKWMYLEEKRFNTWPRTWQLDFFREIDEATRSSNYKGFHLIRFERTSPDDGMLYVDDEVADREWLIAFLRFELPDRYYRSYFEKAKSRSVQYKK